MTPDVKTMPDVGPVNQCAACGARITSEGDQLCSVCKAKIADNANAFRMAAVEAAMGKIAEAEKLLKSARVTLTLIKGGFHL